MGSTPFIHLHTHSAYSLAEGAIRSKELVKLCQKYNMPAVAVTDTNNLFGGLEFAMAARESGIQPIIGCQITVGLDGHQLVLLAQSETGYRNLCRLVSDAYLQSDPASTVNTEWSAIEDCSQDIICLSGGLKGPVSQYLLHNQKKEAETALKKLLAIFKDRLYIELQRHGLAEEDRIETDLIDLAYKHNIPLVATNDCYFPEKSMHEAHDALLCIAEGRYVTEDDRRKVTVEHYFKSSDEMKELFADIPEAIINTSVIAQRCSFLLKPIDPILPPFKTEGGRPETEELKDQSKKGLRWRLDNFVLPHTDGKKEYIEAPYWKRLDYELDVITQMGFPGYFLIVSDFIKWAKDNEIPVGPARGSGAGSVVAWALKITDLDPLQFDLLFERFLNPERVSMPDFDVDFCQERRDEVIRYVQERYGHDHVAQIITFGKLQARAVVRDVGRVLQMPYGQVDRIAKMIPANPANPISLSEALEQDADLRAERKKEDTTDKLITIALQLEGLYRHASTHAAGVVIGDRPLHELIPLYRDPRSDMPVTQFNMKYVEQAGLVKFDFLGLKTMTVIQDTIKLIADKGSKIDILQVPLNDEKAYQLMSRGHTVGVFQLESSGMRDMLRKVKPNRFEDIIAIVSLYRPGPMDNIPKYIAVKEGQEEPDYLHPKLEPYLKETYGIMIYQEQVMQAAQTLAGYTLGGADLLRRAMGKKIKEAMDEEREKFLKGSKEHSDVDEDQANYIFDQIAKFAGYGFNKSHAAAYALIAYWTAWLKANYPVEFMAASMTHDLQNTDKLAVFKQELDRMDITLHPPDINHSGALFTVQDNTIWYALAALKGVGAQAMQTLISERDQNGPFKDFTDLALRLDPKSMNKRQFEKMACAGAFDSLVESRADAFENAETILRFAQANKEEKESGQTSLFGGDSAPAEIQQGPVLKQAQRWDHLETLRNEFDAVGFYLSAHPLDDRTGTLKNMKTVYIADILSSNESLSSKPIKMAGMLLKKQIRVSPKSGKKYAFLQMSDPTGVYEVMMFSEQLMLTKDILNEGEALMLNVTGDRRDDQVRFTAQKVDSLDHVLAGAVREMQITLDDEKPLQQLHDLLKVEGKGAIRIAVNIPVRDDLTAEIELPGRWAFSPEARQALSKTEGVLNIADS